MLIGTQARCPAGDGRGRPWGLFGAGWEAEV